MSYSVYAARADGSIVSVMIGSDEARNVEEARVLGAARMNVRVEEIRSVFDHSVMSQGFSDMVDPPDNN